MYRQGDVLLIPVEELPHDAKLQDIEDDKIILAEGEATGHHHAIANRNAQLFEAATGMFLMLAKAAQLYHQEHDKIDLPPGNYKVTRQREYSPEAIRNVAD
jgi:hypothetical protein